MLPVKSVVGPSKLTVTRICVSAAYGEGENKIISRFKLEPISEKKGKLSLQKKELEKKYSRYSLDEFLESKNNIQG
jgi:hypothetical protein